MTDTIADTYQNLGFFGHLGLEMNSSEDGHVRGRLHLRPELLNRAGFVHGGVLCSMIDFGACAAGLHTKPSEERQLAVTLSLTTHFTKQAAQGWLHVEGKLLSSGRRIYSAQAHVFDDDGALIAHGIGTFQRREQKGP